MWRQHTDIQTYRHTYIHTDRQTEPNYYIDAFAEAFVLQRTVIFLGAWATAHFVIAIFFIIQNFIVMALDYSLHVFSC